MRRLTESECRQMMSEGEVPESIRSEAERVAVILTQGWCGDWKMMRRYLDRIPDSDVRMMYVEYDQEPFFEELKTFKETEFKNAQLPYIRYYVNGELVNQSNVVLFKRRFLRKFGG